MIGISAVRPDTQGQGNEGREAQRRSAERDGEGSGTHGRREEDDSGRDADREAAPVEGVGTRMRTPAHWVMGTA